MERTEAQKQLDLIERTIEQAKRSFYKRSAHFLIWGWGLFLAALLQYFFIKTGTAAEYNWTPWPVMAIICGIVASIHERKRRPDRSEPTDRIFGYLWSAFGVTLLLIIFGSVAMEINPNPYVILLMGLPTFASGGILRSKALLTGGCLIWIIGTASLFVPTAMTALAFALAVLLGYIVPGHILRAQEEKEKARENG